MILEGRDQPIADVASLSDPTMSGYYEPMRRLPASIAPALAEELRKEARAAIREAVIPAHATLLKFMRGRYLPGARKTLAAQELPNGRAWYRRQIIDYVTEDLSPEQIHQIGLDEVARIRKAMQKIIDELKFKGDFAAFLAFLRSDQQFYAKTPDELLAQAAWVAKRADGALPRYFGKLPRLPYGVQAVPDAIAPFYTGGRYVPPAEGSQEPGWYWVNTHDLKSRPLYTLPALTLHEAVPGHHLQIAIQQELGGLPWFRRQSEVTAYVEGWGLYSEFLGYEMGMYRDSYERFGKLSMEMWRACRLVADTGIHWKGWTLEQARTCFTDNTALAPKNIENELQRYISWPGQALAYKIGELKIRQLRTRAEQKLGARFDIKAFHRQVLQDGSLPLGVLEAKIDRWISAQKPAA